MANMYRIMLAGPSLLYAPIYLAKIERLTYAYKWITLDHPSLHAVIGHEAGQNDPVFHPLLSLDPSDHQDGDIVLAVADPFRLRYKQAIGLDPSGPNGAVVVGGLIKKMCLWLVSDVIGQEAKSDLASYKFKDHLTQIVVHRKEMTSYVLMRSLLKAQGVQDEEAEQLLFHNARIGEEHIWTRWRPRKKCDGRKLPFAYLTAEGHHAVKQYARGATTVPFYAHPEVQYKDFLFTALVTSTNYWENNQDFVCELREGVRKGIEFIGNAPERAARCLIRDVQLCKLLPGNQTETQIKASLESITKIKAFVETRDLKVQPTLFNNALGIHKTARPELSGDIVTEQELKNVFAQIFHPAVNAPVFARIFHPAVNAPQPAPHFPYYGKEPTEDVQHRSNPFLIWPGTVLGFAAAAFSFSLVRANEVSMLQPVVKWFVFYSNAFGITSWSIDKWIAFIMSSLALLMLLPALSEFLEGESEKNTRNALVVLASTSAVISLTYTLADWSTTVGALCNWAVVCYASYKVARRYWRNRLSFGKLLIANWAKFIFSVDLTCHVVSEWISSRRTEPFRRRWLWMLLTYRQRRN